MEIGFSEGVDAFYGKTDGRPDCRDRTKKYLICNYWGQQEFSFNFKENGVMTLFFSALRGFGKYPETQAESCPSQVSMSRISSLIGYPQRPVALTVKQA